MALPPSDKTDEAFLREVDEELRRDQMLGVWKRWGKWIVGLVVVGLAAFGGYLLWDHFGNRSAEKQGDRFDAAIQAIGKGDAAKAAPELKALAAEGEPGYRASALFIEAQQLAAKNDLKGAAAKYSAISGDTKLPQPFRDLALLRQTAAEYDTLKPQVVVDRLKGLADPASAYFGSAGELVAAAYAKLGKRAEAGKLYAQIGQTESVPESIRQRAVQMANVLGVDATAQSGEKKAQ